MALEVPFGCAIVERGGVPLLQWDEWRRDGVLHGITTRRGGISRAPYATFNLADYVGDAPAAVMTNRAKLRASLGDMNRPLVTARQVHGGEVFVVDALPGAGAEPPAADALVTDRDDVFLGLLFADCVPVLFYDRQNRAVGVAHGGWRGLAADVLAHTVQTLRERYGTDPARLQAAIGPHIGVCCYEVGAEVTERFMDVPRAIRTDTTGRTFLNLSRVARAQLSRAGLALENVSISAPCTSCFVDAYYSHRSEGNTGRFAAAIGLEPRVIVLEDGAEAEEEAPEPEIVALWEEPEEPARIWRIDEGI